MTEQESKDLKMEIQHIFDSGANEMRIFNMIEMFLDRRDEAINYTHCCTELNTDEKEQHFNNGFAQGYNDATNDILSSI
jgi:hypothetical protein